MNTFVVLLIYLRFHFNMFANSIHKIQNFNKWFEYSNYRIYLIQESNAGSIYQSVLYCSPETVLFCMDFILDYIIYKHYLALLSSFDQTVIALIKIQHFYNQNQCFGQFFYHVFF